MNFINNGDERAKCVWDFSQSHSKFKRSPKLFARARNVSRPEIVSRAADESMAHAKLQANRMQNYIAKWFFPPFVEAQAPAG